MKIDNYEQAVELMAKMEQCLPIPVTAGKPLLQTMRDRGNVTKAKQELLIDSMFYGGDEGGIICSLNSSEDDKENYVVSLTHLHIDPQHPLAEEIIAYQALRIKRLKAQNQVGFKSLLAEARTKPRAKKKGFGN
ncbi:MAG: hypothetical protein F6J93_06565 [Oscillatoria sp. SIO1A7]|nr:hypothetical protein [Oscillatoria sp. SIO1A7]